MDIAASIKDIFLCYILLLFLNTIVYSQDQPSSSSLPTTTPTSAVPSSTGESSIFSDLWNSFVTKEKKTTCPGDCVHAIAALLCDHVLEGLSCGESYLRCCVPNGSSYGTAVETSPPFDENLHNETIISNNLTSPPFNISSSSSSSSSSSPPPPLSSIYNTSPLPLTSQSFFPSFNSPSQYYSPSLFYSSSPYPGNRPWYTSSSPVTESYGGHFSLPTRQTSSPSSSITLSSTTTPSTTTTERINSRCPGVCVLNQFVRYCSNISAHGICDNQMETCCLQSERDSTNFTLAFNPNRTSSPLPVTSTSLKSPMSPSSPTPPSTSVPISTSSASTTPTINPSTSISTFDTTQSSDTDNSIGLSGNNSEVVKNQDQSNPDENTCDGLCVISFLSFVCDEIDSNKVCSNGGTCCLNREPSTTLPPLPECLGACIPFFLRGVCQRPSELIYKTSTCNSGTICCHYQDRRPVNERPPPPPLFSGHPPGPPRIPSHPPLNNYPHGPSPPGHPQPPTNIQLWPRPSMPMNPQGLRPPMAYHPPQSRPPQPTKFAPFIPNRKPQIQISSPSSPAPSQPPISAPTGSSPHKEPDIIIPGSSLAQSEPDVSETSPSEIEALIPLPDTFSSSSSSSSHSSSFGNKNPSASFPGGVPFCPGPCIDPILRFSCFGGNAIYSNFFCAKQGQICCATLDDIQAYEDNIKANNGIWKPTIPSTKVNSSSVSHLDESGSLSNPTVILPPVKPPPRQATPYSCGSKGNQRRESPRIVGGGDALPGEWCWHVALINADNQYICGGALIGSQWILTAAHCITNLVRNDESIYVRVGDYDLSAQIKSKSAQTQKVSTTYIHHNHNGASLDNDIALLKIQSPVQINDSICLVCLPERGSARKPGQRCTVTGYGYREESGPIALKIREAEVPIVDDQECTTKIQAVTEKTFILPTSSFCAGGEKGNDACQGDGGGPLVCEVDGFYELTGLVSWGFGCGRLDVPGVYVKVSNFIGWIHQIISVNNQ